ncbi:hypothetical protein [Scytonema sp. PCC 10023]|uniref:hypothetical protein n=1 Tax=Scytonema sp. PCC 10023 TaxID=1680591 RepID=UPI0039C72D8E
MVYNIAEESLWVITFVLIHLVAQPTKTILGYDKSKHFQTISLSAKQIRYLTQKTSSLSTNSGK